MNNQSPFYILGIEVHIDGDTVTLNGTEHPLPGGKQLTYRRLLVRHDTDGAWRFDRASGTGPVDTWGVHQ